MLADFSILDTMDALRYAYGEWISFHGQEQNRNDEQSEDEDTLLQQVISMDSAASLFQPVTDILWVFC